MEKILFFLILSCLSFASGKAKFHSNMDYSQFQLVYSYEYVRTGEDKYFKIIKYLSSQRKLSAKVPHYIYYYNGNYYIFHNYPVTNAKSSGRAIILSETEAEEIMTK